VVVYGAGICRLVREFEVRSSLSESEIRDVSVSVVLPRSRISLTFGDSDRTPAFSRFRRGVGLADQHPVNELVDEYLQLQVRHESFAERFGVGHPREAEYDERAAPERRDAVSEWHGVIERAADVREAYWQETRESLPPLESTELPDAATGAETATADEVERDSDAMATALAETPAAATLSVEIGQLLMEELQSNEEFRRFLSTLASDEDPDSDPSYRGSTDPR